MTSASDEQLINELGLRRRHRWSLYDHPNLIRAASILFFLVVFFPILINTASGAKNVSASIVEVGRAYQASRRQIMFKIVFPAALPFIMAGVRIAVGRGLVGMIVAELFTAITGLGAMLSLYGNIFETAKMFVVIIVLAGLGIGLIHATQMLERKMARWKESERAVS